MTVYWLLFGFAAAMALVYPNRREPVIPGAGQLLAIMAFVAAYVLLAGLRYQVGGDWITYDAMYETIRPDSLGFALTYTDPAYGALNWLSAQLGTGVYGVNAVCAVILGYGVARVALATREPWLGILIAIPYLLIVVGLGYIRQGAAIGFILLAVDALGRGNRVRVFWYLALAAGFHSTAAVVFPLFGFAMTRRYKALALVLGMVGVAALFAVLAPRFAEFETGYINAEYESGGALVRLLMSLFPSLFLLARWKSFAMESRARTIWLGLAVANLVAAVALILSPSSTAVDRMALYFSVVQIVVAGSSAQLIGAKVPVTMLVRLFWIGLAAAIQVVFLVYATHAYGWVPYKSVLQFL